MIRHIISQLRFPSRAGRLGDAWCLLGFHAIWSGQRHTGPCVCWNPRLHGNEPNQSDTPEATP